MSVDMGIVSDASSMWLQPADIIPVFQCHAVGLNVMISAA